MTKLKKLYTIIMIMVTVPLIRRIGVTSSKIIPRWFEKLRSQWLKKSLYGNMGWPLSQVLMRNKNNNQECNFIWIDA